MFDLSEQPVSEPELSLREQAEIAAAKEWKRRRIEDTVYSRMRDPEYVIDAIQIVLSDNELSQKRMADLIMGYGDRGILIGNLKLDVMDWITHQVTKEADRGVL